MAAIESYREFLTSAQAQHEKTIRDANEQLERLLSRAAKVADPPQQVAPQSVWITGNDGEKMLLLNKPAADLIDGMLGKLKEVVAELAKLQEQRR